MTWFLRIGGPQKRFSPKEQIKKAYNLARKFHHGVSGSHKKFKQIKDSYEYLMSRD
ncbi:hypothetical protein OAK75_05970 [Bacteriovoracales bacterium]|nr:hypothetical protein [Bacteriovoracales bacterium]